LEGAPCAAAWRADAVFVGHVVSIDAAGMPSGRQIQLAVAERFRGFASPQLTITMGGGDCDYPFQIGESYLVYAYRDEHGQLTTSKCTRTRPVVQAAEDLAYLRSLADVKPGDLARVPGKVLVYDWRPGQEMPAAPNVVVTATGQGRRFTARANARGDFVLSGLPLGKYELVATAPKGYVASPQSIEIHDPRGCGTQVVYVRSDGRVTGRVVDGSGAGVRGLPLELVPVGEIDRPYGSLRRASAWTAADGTFEMREVRPGEYLLGFHTIRDRVGRLTRPHAFHPGTAASAAATRIVVTTPGERVRLRDFVVPRDIQLITVEGVVLDEAGSPVAAAEVGIRETTGDSIGIGQLVTGVDGRFAFSVISGVRYFILARQYVKADAASRWGEVYVAEAVFAASPGVPPLTMVPKPQR
jgi:hypothetical protein